MKLLPVVHPISYIDAMRAIELCVAVGVKGVFLINQGMSAHDVTDLSQQVKLRFPELFVGLNLLGSLPVRFQSQAWLDAVWADNAIGNERPHKRFKYFGGIDFKYQKPIPPEEYKDAIASVEVDVVTTSGPGTGKAPTLSKIENFRRVYDGPLAIASGITPDNVDPFIPLVNHFLVATGIEERFGVFDRSKLHDLHQKLAA